MYKNLIRFINILLFITLVGQLWFVIYWTSKLVLQIDFEWISDSYFLKVSKFNWLKFIHQFLIIEIIFILPFGVIYQIFNLLNSKIQEKFKKILAFTFVIYLSITTSITLSLTANELVFTFLSSIIAFIALVIPAFKFFFKFQFKPTYPSDDETSLG